MEFLDEFESRPKFVFQSKHLPRPEPDNSSRHFSSPSSLVVSLHRPTILTSLTISIAIFVLFLLHLNFEPYKSILLWLSLSLLLGPFAPPRLTAGDIRVGLGPPLKDIPDSVSVEADEKSTRKSIRSHRKSTAIVGRSTVDFAEKSQPRGYVHNASSPDESKSGEEDEWNATDEELLRKLMSKHPVGMPGRWEAIAEGFKGKHQVETVIAKAKETGLRKVGDGDSYEKFLKTRKPVDKRVLREGENGINGEIGVENQNGGEWSGAEDLALLNALKAFPKDVGMRWEKIAASVPGKTKSACMKRMAVLKKDFRCSKGSSAQIP